MKEKIFNPKSPLALTINIIFDIFVLSILWFISSLPIFTTGLAYSGLYYAIGDENPISVFINTIKKNYKQGILVDFIVLIILLLISWSMWISYQMMVAGDFIAMVIFILGAIVLVIFIGYITYLFPILAKYEYKTKELFEICLKLSIKHIFFTIIISISLLLIVYFVYHFWIALFFIPAIFALIHKSILEKILLKHSKQ